MYELVRLSVLSEVERTFCVDQNMDRRVSNEIKNVILEIDDYWRGAVGLSVLLTPRTLF